MAEKLDVYNYKRIKTGKIIERGEKIGVDKDDYILAVQCWIINPKGEILLTRRRLDKGYGGMWEPTGGLAQSGETSIQAVQRELNEEIGVNVSKKELNFIKEKIDSSDMCNVFRDVYVIKKDIKINEFKFNDGEVIDAKYINIEMLDDMIQKGESFEWLTYFIDLYKEIK